MEKLYIYERDYLYQEHKSRGLIYDSIREAKKLAVKGCIY